MTRGGSRMGSWGAMDPPLHLQVRVHYKLAYACMERQRRQKYTYDTGP